MGSKFRMKIRCMALVFCGLLLSGMAPSPPLVGGPAPDFALKTVNDRVIKLADLRGKFVVLNFWATWCVACVKEMPEFQKLHQSAPEKNIAVIAINFAESKNKVEEYLQNRQISFPILLDRHGDISGKYKVRNLPVTYLISPDGIIQEEIVGGVTHAIIDNKINQYKASL